WKWFLASVVVCLLLAVAYLLVKNPVYQVDGKVLLREDDKKSSSMSSAMGSMSSLSDLGMMMGSKNIDNEVGIFNTRMLMKNAIWDLGLYKTVKMKDGLKNVDVYPESPFNFSVDSTQISNLVRLVTFKIKPNKNGEFTIKGKAAKHKFIVETKDFPITINTPDIDITIERNYSVPYEGKDNVSVTIVNPNILTEAYQKEVAIAATSKKTSIIFLNLKSANVQKAKDFINHMITLFNEEAIQDKKLETENLARFVQDRLLIIQKQLSDVEKSVERYKQENNLTDISAEAQIFLSQTSGTKNRQVEIAIQKNMLKFLDEYIKEENNKDKMIPSIGVNDGGLITYIVKYNEVLAMRNKLASTSTPSSPAISKIDVQLASMRENIIVSIDNLQGSLDVMLKDIHKQDIILNNKLSSIPRIEREFVEIAREKETMLKLYLYLSQRREEANLSLASTTPKAKIIDAPMPSIKPIAPRMRIILALALLMGLAIPYGFIYIMNLLRTRINSTEDISKYCNAEIIGEIVQGKESEHVIVTQDSTSPGTELFRLLRTKILFQLREPQKKVILITSTIAGEGKTYIGANLSVCLTLMDKKVLFMGLDIRKPRIADYLNIPKGKGVSEYLSGADINPASLICSTKYPNLDVVQAGAIPPNPNELLMSPKLDELMNYYREKYDYIVVDTAPIGIVSDTFLLDRISDISLYVSRIGHVHKNSIKHINEIIDNDSLKNLFIVANGVDKKGSKGYGYGY
ncbi:polysaccharide biosynthesis tyrosine autokinase, partial [Bacteroidales bacterium OttesenSCG-928-A17]|nr:polysaccharide biosynthesis tyrosine autokinase [Bacteroidales bacterium OttesenSCG-928-A17]